VTRIAGDQVLVEVVRTPVVQGSHGFSVRNVVRYTATGWVLALGTSFATAADGVVLEVLNANEFIVGTAGIYEDAGHGLLNNTTYYLSAVTPGLLTTSRAGIGQSILKVTDGNHYIVAASASRLQEGVNLYDAVVPDDFPTPSAAFNDVSAPLSVFVRNGTYLETADVLIPKHGILIGESPDGTILNLAGGFSVGADGTGVDYATGTVSITNGSFTVTGVGVAWQTAGVTAGDWILLGIGDKTWWQIAAVPTQTTITLVQAYQGQTVAGEDYEVKSLAEGITLNSMTLLGNTAGPGLRLVYVHSAHVADIHVTDCGVAGGSPVAGAYVQDTVDSFFRNLIVSGGAHHGLEITDSNANTIDAINVRGAAGHGIQITGGNQDLTINSGHVAANDLNGINITGASDETLLINVVVSENNGGGIFMAAGVGDAHARACTVRNNNTFGIDFAGVGNSAQGCQLSSQTTGYGIVARAGGQITGCLIRGNGGGGVQIIGDNVNVAGCRIYSNIGNGVTIEASADNTVLDPSNTYFSNTVNQIVDNSLTTRKFVVRYEFSAGDLASPTGANWAVNDFASLGADTVNSAFRVRRFDDTVDEGVGFTIHIPDATSQICFKFISRGQAAGGGTVTLNFYERDVPDNGLPSAWSGATALTALVIPANTNWQKDMQEVSLASLGLVAGGFYQIEIVRPGGTLVGDWTLLDLVVEIT
jgi:hypothetical protein